MSFKQVLDKPGMIEAKILLPNSTSTPLKPFNNLDKETSWKTPAGFKSSASESSMIISRTKPFDSGFSSLLSEKLDEESRLLTSNDSNSSISDDGQCQKPSLFESILKSRNHSISLEQLVEKVNLKKEQRNEERDNYDYYRSRSLSTSELTSKRKPMPKVDKLYKFSSSELSLYSDLSCSGASGESRSSVWDGHSPTLDQVFTMTRSERSYSDGSNDYDLSELVANIKINAKRVAPVRGVSPCSPDTAAACRRTPESLFGLETLQMYHPVRDSARPKLECITESDQDLSCTPEEYYTTGLSPLPPRPQPKFSQSQYHLAYDQYPTLQQSVSAGSSFPPAGYQTPVSHYQPPEEPLNSTWSGLLPHKQHQSPVYSCKIFLGGVPWDVTEQALIQAFSQFGPIRIEWPGKDQSPSPPKGYVYIVFDHERHIPSLLSQCSQSNGAYYFKISSRRMRSKEVQIIPWVLDDSNYIKHPKQKLNPQKTVFVGALHGMLNAEILARIFNDLFGGVVYAGIDTDKHRYPIGSGRVTFSSNRSYMKAVSAAFVEIKCQQFNKRVQVDPYLEDALCSSCLLKQGPYFCRDLVCFKYYCRYCWESGHAVEPMKSHRPLMRNTRTGGGPATRPTISLTSAAINVADPS